MQALDEAVASESFEQVLQLVNEAIESYDYTVLYYARARALHRLGRWTEAEEGYTEFLRLYAVCDDPDQLAAAAREHRLTVIERQRLMVATGVPLGANDDDGQTAEPHVVDEPDDTFNVAWVPVIAGGTLLVTAIVHELVFLDIEDEQLAADRAGDTARFFELEADWESAKTRAWVLWGTGTALVAGGLIWVLLSEGEASDSTENLSLGGAPRPGGFTFTLGGSF